MQRTLGHRRARAAALPAQPDADRRVAGLPGRAARRARLRLRRQRQAPQARRRRPGPRRAGGPGPRDVRRPSPPDAQTFDTIEYADPGRPSQDLRDGRVNGVLTIPPEFSRRVLAKDDPRVALIEDNTDNFVVGDPRRDHRAASSRAYEPGPRPAARARPRPPSTSSRSTPTSPTSSTCCPARSCMSIFMMVMIGGGIIYIDDKARGLHEGYLVTPITKLELIAGLQPLGHDQGGPRRDGAHDRRLARGRDPEPARARCACSGSSSSSW